MPQPHDRLFRYVFSDPANAIGELQRLLPRPLVEALDWAHLEVVSGASYVDEALAERQTDLLYTVPLREDAEQVACVYLLFEHQSSVDPMMPARLLSYLARIWDQWMRENPDATRLPVIVPTVLHHSASGWTVSQRFSDLLDLAPDVLAAVRPHVPDFSFLLDDISRVSDEELHERAQTAVARLTLWALSRSRDPGAVEVVRWSDLLEEVHAAPAGVQALRAVFRYLGAVREDDLVRTLAASTRNPLIEAIAMTYEQRMIDKGRAQGLEEGRREGAVATLGKLLELKFGPLDEATRARLDAAEAERLDLWAGRVLTAPTLESVFAG